MEGAQALPPSDPSAQPLKRPPRPHGGASPYSNVDAGPGAGIGAPGPGANTRRDLLGEDPASSFAAIVEKACAAAAVDDLDQVAHLSFGDYPIREYLWQINFFRGVRDLYAS